MYVVLHEQSNKSLATSEFFHPFNITTSSNPYTMQICSVVAITMGRRATNFMIESQDVKIQLPLNIIEHDMITEDRREIPSPEVALTPTVSCRQDSTCGSRRSRPPSLGSRYTAIAQGEGANQWILQCSFMRSG